MESRAKAAGHAIHPMLIVFPLGLLATAVIFDIIYLASYRDGFAIASAYMIAAGVIGGVVAGFFGFLDYLRVPRRSRARRIGALHGGGNVLVLALFAASWALRLRADNWEPSPAALGCSFAGVVVALFTAWLGGELVERLGIGVDRNADVNAPSSLRHKQVYPSHG
ncbi:MAG: DUF2231 domain-containing protein [Micromonosporaceae bacterium]|nr:DUF2231 domain-containing protein [Micromonosporaceae bacterium]